MFYLFICINSTTAEFGANSEKKHVSFTEIITITKLKLIKFVLHATFNLFPFQSKLKKIIVLNNSAALL